MCATPSKTYKELFEKAAAGDQFARDFFSIFIPYKNHDQARKICESVVDRALKAHQSHPEEIVFYKCRHYHFEKKCTIYSERPQLCRDFPGSPFVILSENCAFYEWAQKCKEAYKKLQMELEDMKSKKKELENLKYQQKCINLLTRLKKLDNDEYKFMFIVPSMCVVSPGGSWIK
ncbi:MAG: hypothetical protein A2Y25_09120 [Candidatus Melainabacteria bacterium GWF2_37_15]|nr:MAG: hypothetical protein A2Y25_09120 [Candidatus Melainabacteria bacterium GWF2_37_15]